MQASHTVEIARRGFTGVIRKFRRDALPLVEASLEANFFRGRGGRERGRAFESSNVGHELPIIVVAVAAFHRLDVPAELLVELVHEHQRAVGPAKASRDPLIPPGDHYEWGLQIESPP